MANYNTIHGGVGTRLYRVWRCIKARCYYRDDMSYRNYGGRGITMCDEWKEDFAQFRDWAMMNGYQDDLTIDRIDSDKHYEPDNCRWLTRAENARRAQSTYVTAFGETRNILEWSKDERCSICYRQLVTRINQGINPEEAITLPHQCSHPITAFGETKNIRTWSKDARCAVSYSRLKDRLKAGMAPEEAISRPPIRK